MNIFARLFHRAKNKLSPPLTPCMQALEDELNRRAIRELQKLEFSLKASEVTEKQAASIVLFYRDQRRAGVSHGDALWRARNRIQNPKGNRSDSARVAA